MEPQLRLLRYAHAGRIAWRTVMGAMIEDWSRFEDPLNAVHRPAQMAPLWIQARETSGMPIDPDVWVTSPPASSIPACRAVKAAGLQGARAADLLLRRLREAIMIGGRDISDAGVIRSVAQALAASAPGAFDAARFEADFAGEESLRRLQDDVKEVRFRRIGRFPSLMLRTPRGAGPLLTGCRPAAEIDAAIRAAVPDLPPARRVTAAGYRAFWGDPLDREIAVALGQQPPSPAQTGTMEPEPAAW